MRLEKERAARIQAAQDEARRLEKEARLKEAQVKFKLYLSCKFHCACTVLELHRVVCIDSIFSHIFLCYHNLFSCRIGWRKQKQKIKSWYWVFRKKNAEDAWTRSWSAWKNVRITSVFVFCLWYFRLLRTVNKPRNYFELHCLTILMISSLSLYRLQSRMGRKDRSPPSQGSLSHLRVYRKQRQ